MVRFCDKNVYTIYTYDLYRVEMLRFFLNEKDEFHRDVVLVLNADDSYYGIMTYPRIVMCEDPEDRIMRESIVVSEHFFEDARAWFKTHPRELLPILDKEGQVCGFCYNDEDEHYQWKFDQLEELETAEEIPYSFFDWQEKSRQIWIRDCNELAYRCYCLFRRLGYPVYVEGEAWEWLGVFNEIPPCILSERFYIYAEGTPNVFWSWTYEETPPNVSPYFHFLFSWANRIRRHIYEKMIRFFMEKGIMVSAVTFPGAADIDYYTFLELKSKSMYFSMEEIMTVKRLPEEKRNILCEIMGTDEAEMLYVRKHETEGGGFHRISYTDIGQEVLDGTDGDGRIYVIGPCIVEGYGNFTENTFVAQLQEKVKEENYSVVKVPFTSFTWHLWSEQEIKNFVFRKKDIVLLLDEENLLSELDCPQYELLPIYNRRDRETWMPDSISLHLNKAGVKAIADFVYDTILKEEIGKRNAIITENKYLHKGEVLSELLQKKVWEYVESIKRPSPFQGRNIGSIVMNCNPFTFGHQYLIEYAASRADILYVFVVEEDRSVFPFELRKQMVEEGTAHLNNVCVVPSGEWVLSYQTFPVYFGKAQKQEETADAGMDLEIFARYVAPSLGITHRFVGEEPADKITRQYNEQMKKILGGFGIQVEEIERMELDGKPVSASYVRKCMEEGHLDEAGKYVPESTRRYIEERIK